MIPLVVTPANSFASRNPLIVQGDHTVLVEVDNPLYPQARDALARFAELVKSPEHIHTYRLTPLSIWNACAVGESAETIVSALRRFSKYPLPQHVEANLRRFRRALRRSQTRAPGMATWSCVARDLPLAEELARRETLRRFFASAWVRGNSRYLSRTAAGSSTPSSSSVSRPKTSPATSRASRCCLISRCARTRGPACRSPRGDYQREAAEVFHAGGAERGGSGVIVLAVRRGQDDRGHGLHGPGARVHADPDHECHRRPPVEARAARQDHAARGRHRRIPAATPKKIRPVTIAHLPDSHPSPEQGRASSRTSACSTSATGA